MKETKTTLFIWDKNYQTDIESVDEQHKHLVELINGLSRKVSEEQTIPRDDIIAIFNELFDYTKYHFSDEERIMFEKRLDNGFIKDHIKNHKLFLEEISALYDDFISENGSGLDVGSLLSFLINWLAFHILGQDKKMARQIRYIEQGNDAATALKIANEMYSAVEVVPLVGTLNNIMEVLLIRNRELMVLKKNLRKIIEKRTEQLTQANEHLENLAATDQLTGLKNRRYALNFLNMVWHQTTTCKQFLSILMLDLDNFKDVNDNYGHDMGDKVLQVAANTIKNSVKPENIVCRLGGDEFLVICLDTTLFDAIEIAQNVLKNINELKIQVGSGFWLGSISIGVAQVDQQMQSSNDLIKSSDLAIYEAKKAGKNCVMFASNRKKEQKSE